MWPLVGYHAPVAPDLCSYGQHKLDSMNKFFFKKPWSWAGRSNMIKIDCTHVWNSQRINKKCYILNFFNQRRWHTAVIPALERLGQDIHEFEASLAYKTRLSLTPKSHKPLDTVHSSVTVWARVSFEASVSILTDTRCGRHAFLRMNVGPFESAWCQ